MSAPTLYGYQTAALDAIHAALAAGQNRVLMKLPTGTGKTVTFAAMLVHEGLRGWLGQFPANERKMLVIAHREELLEQAAAKILAQNPGLHVSIEQADRYASRFSDVVVASIQTLQASKFRRLKRLISQHVFRIVVVDEAHHAAAATYRTSLVHLGFLPAAEASEEENAEAPMYDDVEAMEKALTGWEAIAPKDRLLVGVTATPNRSDAIGLGCVFQTIAYSYALKDAIDDGWLVPIKPWVIETAANLDEVKTSHGDFNQRQLADAVNNPERNKLAVAGWMEHAKDESTIAFTVDVAHAHALAREFNDQGITAAAVSGETDKEERRDTLRRFTAGDLQVITNCMVLTEGTDLPRTGCILHAKPTKSATLYEQMTGRGLRLYPGKVQCIVLDVVDVARRHSLQTAPVLYGLSPNVKAEGKTLDQVEDEIDALLSQYAGFDVANAGRKTLAELRAKASTFDIWTVRSMGEYGTGLVMNWIRVSEDVFKLSYPWQETIETLTVERDILGHFGLMWSSKGKTLGAVATHPRAIAAGVPTATAALHLAEAFVQQERREVTRLKAQDAPWRLRPASPKQIEVLRRMRAPIAPGLTMGAASDLIDRGKMRRP